MKLLFVLLFLNHCYADIEPVLIKTLTEVTGGGLSVSGSTVTTLGDYSIVFSSINITTGAGLMEITSTGTLKQCSINTPNPTANYSFEILTNDTNGFAIMGHGNLIGKTGIFVESILIGKHAIYIADATNGVYKIRCLIKK